MWATKHYSPDEKFCHIISVFGKPATGLAFLAVKSAQQPYNFTVPQERTCSVKLQGTTGAKREPLHLMLSCVNHPCIYLNAQISHLWLCQSDRSEIIHTHMHRHAHRQAHTADQKGIWLSNMKKKTKGVIVSCIPWTPGATANVIIWKPPPGVCHGCGFYVRQKLPPKAAKSPPIFIWFLPLSWASWQKDLGSADWFSHFWGCFFFCSSDDFQISLATAPHLFYALRVHICTWQRYDFVQEPLFSLAILLK